MGLRAVRRSSKRCDRPIELTAALNELAPSRRRNGRARKAAKRGYFSTGARETIARTKVLALAQGRPAAGLRQRALMSSGQLGSRRSRARLMEQKVMAYGRGCDYKTIAAQAEAELEDSIRMQVRLFRPDASVGAGIEILGDGVIRRVASHAGSHPAEKEVCPGAGGALIPFPLNTAGNERLENPTSKPGVLIEFQSLTTARRAQG